MKLREAAQAALEALEYLDGYNGWVEVGKEIDALRSALSEDRPADAVKTSDHFPDAKKMVALQATENILREYGLQALDFVAEWKKIMADFPGTKKMMATSPESRQVEPVATINEMETVEPVAWMWRFEHDDGAAFTTKKPEASICDGVNYVPLYPAPPKLKPLTEKQIESAVCGAYVEKALTRYDITIARAIERTHGIGGEE